MLSGLKFKKKMRVILLQLFAAQQQASTLKRQKSRQKLHQKSIIAKFSFELSELTLSFLNSQELA